MRAALALARRGLGRVAPNPAVGCVLVRDGRVVGRGWTQPGGRPHAETEALGRAGAAARGATAYVTLEPCSHRGRTAACAEALVEAGIARCVIAHEDPDRQVSGRGIARLREAGIEVDVGCEAPAAEEVNAGYLMHRQHGRPLVTLKLATTLDGRIATAAGESRWITGEAARSRAHALRARHDAVLVGSGTAVVDDPHLDVRLAGLEGHSPVRVVLDRRLRLPLTHHLVAEAKSFTTWLVTEERADHARLHAFQEAGVEPIQVTVDPGGRLSVAAALKALGQRGITRLIVEGGAHVAAALLQAGLVDRIAWFRAAAVMGGDGLPAAVGFGVDHVSEAPRFERAAVEPCGPDLLETYRRRA